MNSPFKDWDRRGERTVEAYGRRWMAVRQEFSWLLVLHTLGNILLCLPLYLSSFRNLQRRSALPILAEEDGIMYTSVFFLTTPILFIINSIIQMKLFVIYNTTAHPWSMIIQPYQVKH